MLGISAWQGISRFRSKPLKPSPPPQDTEPAKGIPAAAPAGVDASGITAASPQMLGHGVADGSTHTEQDPQYVPDGPNQRDGEAPAEPHGHQVPAGQGKQDRTNRGGSMTAGKPLLNSQVGQHMDGPAGSPTTASLTTPAGIEAPPPPAGPDPAPGFAPTAAASQGTAGTGTPALGVNESPLGETPRELIIVLVAACLAGLVGGLLGLGGGVVIGEWQSHLNVRPEPASAWLPAVTLPGRNQSCTQ